MSALDEEHVGITLIRQGWMQGSVLHARVAPKVYTIQTLTEKEMYSHGEVASSVLSTHWNLKEVMLDEDDLLVIVSQVCDIQKSPDKEPYVEAVRACWTDNHDIIHQAKRNSVYYFLLKERINLREVKEALIVDLRPRLLIDKRALVKCCPESYFEGTTIALPRRFRQWLGRRYLRQALANELVAAIQQPIVNAIRKLRVTDPLHEVLDNLREIRFLLLNDAEPFQVEMLFLVDSDSAVPSPTEEDAAILANWINNVLTTEGKAVLESWQMCSTQEISVYDYENAYELALHEFSLP